MVAVKRMKRRFDSWEECMGLREIKVLRKLNHENVVKLKEVIRVNGELNLIFEIAKGTILDLIRENKRFRGARGLPEDVIRNIMSQSLKGMQYIHEQDVFHRDLKPENLLYSDGKLKIADFGLAKDFGVSTMPHTSYVSTRWYRAPEVMLRATNYDQKVDIFALGCIMAELHTGDPLLPGSSEADQLLRLSKLLGQPPSTWAQGTSLVRKLGLQFSDSTIIDASKE